MNTASGAASRDRADHRLRPISRHELVNFVHSHSLELLTAVYLLYVLFGTLIPFDFTLGAAVSQDRSFLGLGSATSRLPDVWSNIALFVPLGFLLHTSLVRTVGHPWSAVVVCTAATATISLTVESIQLLSPTRVSSAVDFAANVLGGGGGAVLALCCRVPERNLFHELRHELRVNRSSALAKVFAGMLCITALVPFTPTLNVGRLVSSARDSTVVPFAPSAALAARVDAAEALGDLDAAAACRRERMFLRARWAAEFLSFGVLGWLLFRLVRQDRGFRPASGLLLAAYLWTALAVAMSVAQILVVSRGFHVTDILARLAGGLAGYAAAAARAPDPEIRSPLSPGGSRRPATAALLAGLAFVLLIDLAPFSFDLAPERARSRIASPEILPFYSYYLGRFDRVCADFWSKMLRFGFLGVGIWMCWPALRRRSLRSQMAVTGGVVMLIATATETAQIVIRSRVASATDVLIAGLAAWLGVLVAQYAVDLQHHVEQRTVAGETQTPPAQPALPPADALIASLIPDEASETDRSGGPEHADERQQG